MCGTGALPLSSGQAPRIPSGKERDVLPTQPARDRMLSHQDWEEVSASVLTVTGFQNRVPDLAACDSLAGSLPATAEVPLTEAV